MSSNGTLRTDEVDRRFGFANRKISDLQDKLQRASNLIFGKACIYTTGSYGRQEASQHSDLDVFIVSLMTDGNKVRGQRTRLRRLDEIVVKADLIVATKELNIPDFDGDGEYLTCYAIEEVTKTLGTRRDDAINTFTARLLLLLESSALIGKDVYDEIISMVIAEYWRDYENHRDDFKPTFLINDILRLWRTLCVSYESKQETYGDETKRRLKKKLKNFKLKHSRLLTCYSTILYLIIIFIRKDTVSPEDAEEMVRLTPMQRMRWALDQPETEKKKEVIIDSINLYNRFLLLTDYPENELLQRFDAADTEHIYAGGSGLFGDKMATVLQNAGGNNALYRMLIV